MLHTAMTVNLGLPEIMPHFDCKLVSFKDTARCSVVWARLSLFDLKNRQNKDTVDKTKQTSSKY